MIVSDLWLLTQGFDAKPCREAGLPVSAERDSSRSSARSTSPNKDRAVAAEQVTASAVVLHERNPTYAKLGLRFDLIYCCASLLVNHIIPCILIP